MNFIFRISHFTVRVTCDAHIYLGTRNEFGKHKIKKNERKENNEQIQKKRKEKKEKRIHRCVCNRCRAVANISIWIHRKFIWCVPRIATVYMANTEYKLAVQHFSEWVSEWIEHIHYTQPPYTTKTQFEH